MATVHLKHCGSWFLASANALKEHIAEKFPTATFTNEPVEVPQGQTKPYELTVNGKLVWSMLENVEGQPTGPEGKKMPLLFADNKWWGNFDASHVAYVDGQLA